MWSAAARSDPPPLPHRATLQLDKGGWHALLRHSVDFPGKFLWANSGGKVCHLYLVGAEDGGVLPTEGVGIDPRKVVTVGRQRRHEA